MKREQEDIAFQEVRRWPRSCACCITTPWTGTRTRTHATDLPVIERYPDGQTLPSPKALGFTPGALLGSVSGELGLRRFLESEGHTLVVTSDKDGPDSGLRARAHDADVVISQPFWPAYLTAERIARAPNLKLAITAGIGSDHVDLQAAIDRGITVAEVTYCNSISVAEHVVMMILSLVRNYLPSYQWVVDRAVEHRRLRRAVVRPGGDGRGDGGGRAHRTAVLRRLKPFDVDLHYTDRHRLPDETRARARPDLPPQRAVDGARVRRGHHQRAAAPGDRGRCSTTSCIAQDEARRYLVNTARGKICDRDAVVRALESGQLAGYAGDVWYPQPAPRTIPGARCRTTA